MNRTKYTALILLLWLSAIAVGDSFVYLALPASNNALTRTTRRPAWTLPLRQMSHAPADGDPAEIVAKRIIVKGDVGGYYRQCVVNEAGRFRRLVGTMTPPDGSDEAEIYVEGKRKLVDGFIRWCRKGQVGLSQVVQVVDVIEEDPTGLYDGFYAKVREDS